jgi:hypothetical protein
VTTFLEQTTRGYWQTVRRHRNTGCYWRGPILLTETQARQILTQACPGPRDEDDLIKAARRGEARMFDLPVQLVAYDYESTPWLEGWI